MNVASASAPVYTRGYVMDSETGKLEWGEVDISGFLDKVREAKEKGVTSTPMRSKQELQKLLKQYDSNVDNLSHTEYKALVDDLEKQGILTNAERMTLMGFTVLDPANLCTATLEPVGGLFSTGSMEEMEKAWKADYLLRRLAEQYAERYKL